MDKVLLIDPRDNVVTALEPVKKGECFTAATERGEESFTALQDIPMGHKLAVRAIPRGTPVFKYGSAIGDVTADIAAGEHVHSHNLSGYRGREEHSNPVCPENTYDIRTGIPGLSPP